MKSRISSVFTIMGLMFAMLCLPASLHAQEARGRITGTVTDSTSASVPGASVKIIDVARNTAITLTTNDDGLFQAPYLLLGTYQVVGIG